MRLSALFPICIESSGGSTWELSGTNIKIAAVYTTHIHFHATRIYMQIVKIEARYEEADGKYMSAYKKQKLTAIHTTTS